MGVLTPVPRGRASPHWCVLSGLNPKWPRTQGVALGCLEAAPLGRQDRTGGKIKPPRSFRFLAPLFASIGVHSRLNQLNILQPGSWSKLASNFWRSSLSMNQRAEGTQDDSLGFPTPRSCFPSAIIRGFRAKLPREADIVGQSPPIYRYLVSRTLMS